MKQVKILGLMIVAAAALMTTVGATTAAATETALCKEKTTISGLPICQEPHLYKSGTKIHAVQETFMFIETPMGEPVECEETTLQLTTEATTAMPLKAKVEAFTFNKCGPYSMTTKTNGTLDIEIIDLPEWTHNGTLTFTGTEVKITTPGVECIYSVGHSGTLTGGAMATIDLKGTLTKVGGNVFCPAGNGSWIAFYKVTSPTPLWVST